MEPPSAQRTVRRQTILTEPPGPVVPVSLVPQSKTTLVVMGRGLVSEVLSRTTFTSAVLVVVATMIGMPLLLLVLSDDKPTEPAPSAS